MDLENSYFQVATSLGAFEPFTFGTFQSVAWVVHSRCSPILGVEFGIFGPKFSAQAVIFFKKFPPQKFLDFFFVRWFLWLKFNNKNGELRVFQGAQVKFFAPKWCLWQRCPHGFKQLLNSFPCLRCLWRTVLLGFFVFRNEQQKREQMDLEKWCVKKVVFGDAWNCFCDLSVQQIEGICNSFNWSLATIC